MSSDENPDVVAVMSLARDIVPFTLAALAGACVATITYGVLDWLLVRRRA